MNDKINNNNIFKNIQNFAKDNIRNILILLGLLFFIFISFQTYNYYKIEELKKTSIKFFKSIEVTGDILVNLNDIKKTDNIFSVLSKLKLIQKYNEENNYIASNKLYKELVFVNNLDKLYKSSISIHASYTLINASFDENSDMYIKDIEAYIANISDEQDSFFSIKKELEYLLFLTNLGLNNSDYKSNSTALKMYNEIINSNLISSSVKERVKKIHEFQLYN